MSIILRLCFILLCFCTTLSYSQYLPEPRNINKKDDKGKQGHWIIYGIDRKELGYEDSAVVEEGYYIDDRKEGTWIKYDEEGIAKFMGEYKNNRPFDPKIRVEPSSKVKEVAVCTFKPLTETESVIEEKEFVPPKVYNPGNYYKYIAPKYSLWGYFPLTYIGPPTKYIVADFYTFVYPDSIATAEITSHTVTKNVGAQQITSSNLAIIFVSENRFWVPQPILFGEDTMEYHSASTVVLRNLSGDTLVIGKDLTLDLKLQYFDGNTWLDAPANPETPFLLPEMKGTVILYPDEIIVTAMPLFENEHRKLRLVFGETISEEFYIENN